MARMDLMGAPNFRDLGGCRGAGGGTVRPGRVFRSEALARLTDEDLRRVAALDIGLVCDLRAADERQRAESRWPAGRAARTLYSARADALAAVRISGWRERIADPAFDAEAARQWILGAYAAMPRLFAEVLAELFAALEGPASPVTLVHCTAGKDRTGFVCAILLFALGVSRDDVFENYLLTRARCPPAELVRGLLGDELEGLPPRALDALLVMADVREEYLMAALDCIGRDFGGIDAYFRVACGLTAAGHAGLRMRLLA
ncbi:tyrosine-protein phosphatase [Castellaniella defragrans]|uniref:Protein-tyrosine phosphatase n=1 Tax=Castellaniella defragrans TaxID=75697 RepID=A0A7W9TQZ9_CASDE|nr:tyrosine-protein phosphatase [Castellaniella defragrans]KAB0606069.1 tyrosine-protein phosphatase [Castellaniella defragrans]MBB6085285.1 protein-tyrosine phosphatase [Castellaniella defragrans]